MLRLLGGREKYDICMGVSDNLLGLLRRRVYSGFIRFQAIEPENSQTVRLLITTGFPWPRQDRALV